MCAVAELLEFEPRDRRANVHFTLRYLTDYFENGPGIEALRSDRLIKSASFLKSEPPAPSSRYAENRQNVWSR